MDLVYRLTEEQDLGECLGILEDRYCYSDALWDRLPGVLRHLLSSGALNSAVLEDRDQRPGTRILQWGASVFVTDAFMREISADPAPHLARRVIAEIIAGRSPVLDLHAIRAGNSREGLNLLVLHYGIALERISPEEFPAVLARIPENFFFIHDGFRLKEILLEFCEPRVTTFSLDAGFQLRTDYADHYQRHNLPAPPPGLRPYRLGVTRAEAEAAPGLYIARIFPYRQPRFAFTHGEQMLLLRALQGDTDEEAARALHLALPTVKTRWRAIYDRVQLRAPSLLPANDLQAITRGTEKRRLLLNYLRQHPEELRPTEDTGPA